MRLKRNCTRFVDLSTQANIQTERFIKKGYPAQFLDQRLSEVYGLNRDLLLVERPKTIKDETNFSFPFNTGYSHEHFSVKKLIHKHWHILKKNIKYLDLFFPKKTLVYRGIPSLKDSLAPSVCDPPNNNILMFFQNLVGFYKRKKCAVCSINSIRARKITKFISTSTSQEFMMKSFITCSTPNVIYLLTCSIAFQYVARTVRPLQVRLTYFNTYCILLLVFLLGSF